MVTTPKKIKSRKFKDAEKACAAIEEIYRAHVDFLREQFDNFSSGKLPKEKVSGYYPYLRVEVADHQIRKQPSKTRHSYGFVSKAGMYETTCTRPDIYSNYYRDMAEHLLRNHEGIKIEIGVSDLPIPIHFALGEDFHLEGDLTTEQMNKMPHLFDQPALG